MIPGEADFRKLLALIADPQKYAARLDELAGKEQSAKDAGERAGRLEPEVRARLDEANDLIRTATSEREKLASDRSALIAKESNLRTAEAKFEAYRVATKNELKQREEAVAAGERTLASGLSDLQARKAQSDTTLKEAQALRAQFQQKLDAIQKAAA